MEFLSGYFYRSDNLSATQPTTPRQRRETSENAKVQKTTALTLNTKQVISETFFQKISWLVLKTTARFSSKIDVQYVCMEGMLCVLPQG